MKFDFQCRKSTNPSDHGEYHNNSEMFSWNTAVVHFIESFFLPFLLAKCLLLQVVLEHSVRCAMNTDKYAEVCCWSECVREAVRPAPLVMISRNLDSTFITSACKLM